MTPKSPSPGPLSPALRAGSCQTCRHWKPDLTGEAWGVRSFADAPEAIQKEIEKARWEWWGEIKDWYYWGSCVLTDMENYEKETNEETGAMAKIPKTLALAFDGSDYHAGLRTRCNFGCVQYEAIARSAEGR